MPKKIIISIILSFCFLSFSSNSVWASLNVPLTVTDYAGIDRVQEPVTSGVPLPESANITSINQLQITDGQGNPVPAQFTVLARWHGTPDNTTKPIKWVLLDFQADVPPNGTSVYYLKDTSNGGNAQNTNLSVQEDNDKIIVNTGKAKFQISKHYFNLFDYVWIDKDNDGQIDDLILSQPSTGGLILTDANGTKYYTTLESPEEIKIEEQGPMRTVVKIRGVFKSQNGSYFAPSISSIEEDTKENMNKFGYAYADYIREHSFYQPYPHSIFYYNCRIYFYNNKDYVRVFLTIENNGANGRSNPEQYFAPIQIVYLDSLNLILKPNSFSQVNVLSEDASAQLTSSDNFTLYQDWHENLTDKYKDTLEPSFAKGIYYWTKKNNQQLSTGKTNPGWIDVNDNSQGIGLAIRHFWQNFPKKLTITPSEIKIGLWPEEGYYPYCQHSDFNDSKYDIYCLKAGRDAGVYLFDAGRHKTYEMFLGFYSGSQDSKTQHLSKSLEEPLMALAPSEWYASTKALGMIVPYGLTSNNPEINEAMQRFEKLQTAMVYEEDSDNGLTINNLKTKNPPYWEQSMQDRFFNWMNFGDLLWGASSPGALHYDWTYSMLLHYIRTGKRKLFDAGVEMAKHRYDVDQYHGDRTETSGRHKYRNHFQFYETSGHADPNLHSGHPSKVSFPTHTWNGGLILYYLLTGDKLAWEAAEENGKAVLNYFGPSGLHSATRQECAYNEMRYEGWSMVNLINLYRVSGNPIYLETAKNIAKNRLLYREQLQGGEGILGGSKNANYIQMSLNDANTTCDEGGCGFCKNVNFMLMYCYISEGLIETQYETQDEEIGNFIVRIADFLKDKVLFGGDYNQEGKYRPWQVVWTWVREDPDGAIRNANGGYGGWGEPVWDLYFVNYFAYAYQLTGNSTYLDWARKLFRDAMFYYTAPGNGYDSQGRPQGYIDPNWRSKISYIDGSFVGSHTKVHGWIGRTNQVYLYTEWQLQQGGLQIITSSLPDGTVDSFYSYLISAVGGTPPYTWTIISGNLPEGLSLNSSSGLISGTPTEQGTFNFTIQVTDANNNTASKSFSITISSALGDLNNDNQVNSDDFLLGINVILGIERDTNIIQRADVNNDGSVNILDIQEIVNIILQ